MFLLLQFASLSAAPVLKTDNSALGSESAARFSFGPVVKKVSPSVVNIYTAKTIRENTRVPMDDAFLRQFFGLPGGFQSVPRERREQSLGSGVIVTEDGYILTNNHVVEAADEIKVALADDKTIYDAKIVGTDPQTDVALIKVEAGHLPAITVTDSDKLSVGDVVLAIGNPFGVGQAVTMGIVSAKGRGGMGIVDYEDFIQTDASINPGNSGGALVDAAGRLVGINSAILSRSGGNQGIGFAIPINLARFVMERLVAEGRVVRGYLGFTLQALTPELARAFGLPENSGALVGDVTPRSPAAEAGLKEGDVVVEFESRKVNDSRQLRLMAAEIAPGAKVQLTVLRDGKKQPLMLRLGDTPGEGLGRLSARNSPPKRSPGNASPLAGMLIEGIDGRTRWQLNLPAQLRGVLVVELDPASPAAIAGLRAGDVILEIQRQPVTSTEEAVTLGKKISAEESVLLRVWSNGSSHYVVVHGIKS
ncbi:MAG: Do family serine endopeptidase [Verrucomicrobia bacterium]|nr:Do family serine endopeptidase [Verrucomicrobiota bacterium]